MLRELEQYISDGLTMFLGNVVGDKPPSLRLFVLRFYTVATKLSIETYFKQQLSRDA